MITCQRAAEWTSRELDDPLPAGRRVALGLHRLLCGDCRRFRTQLAEIDQAVGEAVAHAEATAEPLSDDARERIRHALQDAQAG
ncbi:MAG: hypothetical protein MUF18_00980 [Fimbriiglobus sp.]|nr:hypothetical protein [Fimbriiglobus sp.]